jgi:hypothetical protein
MKIDKDINTTNSSPPIFIRGQISTLANFPSL